MAEIHQKLQALLSPILDLHKAFLIDLSMKNEHGGKLVQVFVDTDNGITIEECAQISRELAHEIDRESLIQQSYRLEVSSPGIDKPLRMIRQYRKNVGRRFKVVHQTLESRQTFVGTLDAVSENQLTFRTDGGEAVALDFERIIESREELPW